MKLFSRTALATGTALALALGAPTAVYAQATYSFNLPAQDLGASLRAVARRTGENIVFDPGAVRGRRAPALSGSFSAAQAIERLLTGSRLGARQTSGGSWVVSPSGEGEAGSAAAENESADAEAIAEILVTGSRTLNADIRRTQDDVQPYVVLDRGAIQRSGASSLEGFLRQQLPMQVNASSNSQGLTAQGNSSSVDLRGLGPDETLILIDGRRLAGRPFSGLSQQPDLAGIPLFAVERVEVLPATASGIYGGGATGGVINVILRRNFSGIEAQLRARGDTSFDFNENRFDLNGGFTFNGGRTSVLISASYSEASTLEVEDRDYFERARALTVQNNPASIFNVLSPPLGATSNIRSSNGAPLVLKPQFGGLGLGSAITFVPYGYGGPTSDNAAALIANAGRYNLDLARTAQEIGGGRASLLNAPTIYSASLTLRHEFSDRVNAFLELGGSRNEGRFRAGPAGGTTFVLAASSPANPFNQSVRVTVPLVGADQFAESRNTSYRAVGGINFKLPFEWNGVVDYTWTRSRSFSAFPDALNGQQSAAVTSGAINIFQDINNVPGAFSPYVLPSVTFGPGTSRTGVAAFRLGGPLGFTLPGGAPTATVTFEYQTDALSQFESQDRFDVTTFFPRSQRIYSGYGEVHAPIFSPESSVPFFHLLDLQIAARWAHYDINASGLSAASEPTPEFRVHRRFSSVNPTFGARWAPTEDIMFRASYGTGFLPPALSQLANNGGSLFPADLFAFFGITDPQRGNEPFGDVLVFGEGSAMLRPERSRSLSIGTVITPRFLQGFRFSADWTRIRKRDNIATAIMVNSQESIDRFLQELPGRFVRSTDPATFGGFPVGPIVQIDATLVNIARGQVEALDFALSQTIATRNSGTFVLTARATRNLENSTQALPDAAIVDVIGRGNSVKWLGNASLRWDYGNFTVQTTAYYIGAYNVAPTQVLSQGSDRIRAQFYNDFYLAYRFPERQGVLNGVELSLEVRNVFDARPPIYLEAAGRFYAAHADPLQRSYAISVRKRF